MKIIIVGGGIAGISTYLHLIKHLPPPPPPSPPHTIQIYESHDPRKKQQAEPSPLGPKQASASAPPLAPPPSAGPTNLNALPAPATVPSAAGGGLGISPNGMRVLRALEPGLHAAVRAQGFVVERFVFKTSGNRVVADTAAVDGARKRPVVAVGGGRGGGGDEGAGEEKEEMMPREETVASSRHGLWRCLREAVKEEGVVVEGKRVSEVLVGEDERPVVRFADGFADESADMVVGADGVKSVVRKAVLGAASPEPTYEGLVFVGGFTDRPVPSDASPHGPAMVFTFGPTGFFGYSGSAPGNSLMWWSTYELPLETARAETNGARTKRRLQERHGRWKDPVVRDLVEVVDVDPPYLSWTVPELPAWGKGGVVLVGDAAHALQSTSGQGASQAFEDGLTLSLLLAHYLRKVYTQQQQQQQQSESGAMSELEAVKLSARKLFEIRSPRTGEIARTARKLDGGKKSHGPLFEIMLFAFFWLVAKVPAIGKLLVGDRHEILFGWSAEREVKKAVEKE
ncbi:hypothetical protein BDY21DRAFT_423490 [Lineolata rhizophorae]|uniref:FAD-binding domain-containing protein n=1 Tax=Lineolata rhizophorae TaxID=578093 RepID=A0A6A6NS31_9PEZI|nr:hypothetical protein BDY21DRAFT_423490 [Lineolata rhizophorae]